MIDSEKSPLFLQEIAENRENARKVGRGQKKREGGGEKQRKLLPSPSHISVCPRPTFRALSHLSRLDSRGGKEETTRSLFHEDYISSRQ